MSDEVDSNIAVSLTARQAAVDYAKRMKFSAKTIKRYEDGLADNENLVQSFAALQASLENHHRSELMNVRKKLSDANANNIDLSNRLAAEVKTNVNYRETFALIRDRLNGSFFGRVKDIRSIVANTLAR